MGFKEFEGIEGFEEFKGFEEFEEFEEFEGFNASRSRVQMFICSNVQIMSTFKATHSMVQMFKCSFVQMFNCVLFILHFSSLSLFRCEASRLYLDHFSLFVPNLPRFFRL